ncbi:MAG: EF-P 5-aminopentanol modification-associated protein YfmF [Anaerorhabdus sp.]
MITYSLAQHVNIHLQKTAQFKDVTVSVRFLNTVEHCDNTSRFFLSQLLSDRCVKYPSKLEVTQQLDQLYGATLYGDNFFTGLAHTLEIRCTAINEKFTQEALLEKQLQFLSSFIFEPILDDYMFFEEIKERLILMVSSFQDNPASYASNQAQQQLNSLLSLKSIPSIKDIEEMTLDNLKTSYLQLIQNEKIDFLILGDVDENQLQPLLKSYFPLTDRPDTQLPIVFACPPLATKTIIENKEVQQSHLLMLYSTKTTILDPFHFPLLVGNSILGGLPSSHLFQEIREKRSLCYSIYSSYESFDGLIKIQTAISKENIEEVQTLIQHQISRIQHGDFDFELLNASKKMLINSLMGLNDYQKRILNHHYNNRLLGKDRALEDLIQAISSVSKEDIVAAFNSLHLNLVYALTQEDK